MLKILHAVVDVLGVGALILIIAAVSRVVVLICCKRLAKPDEDKDENWAELLFLEDSLHDNKQDQNNKQ